MLDTLDASGERMTLLYATPDGEPLYASLGFERIGVIRQHQSNDFRVPDIALPPHEWIRPMRDDMPALVDLGSRACGMDRAAAFAALARVAKGIVVERDGAPAGFAFMRVFGRGHAIGLVVVPTPLHAQALIVHWLAANEGRFTRIDTADDRVLSPWLDTLGLRCVDAGVRMSRRAMPP